MTDMLENDEPTRFQKVKQHLRDNKKTYLVGAGCITAGYFLRPQVVNIVDAFNIKYKSPTTTTVITILERRACREPISVRDKLTGEVYASIRRAATVTGETASKISGDVHEAQERFERLTEDVRL